ncbi:MAG: hypothetical protein ACE5R6_12030 [Candidatus Heimdallarchaeota archaeon]
MFSLRNRKAWLVFVILLLTIISILESSSKTIAENQTHSNIQSPIISSTILGTAQETPETLFPFNGNATVELKRLIKINDYGIILMNDSFIIMNNLTGSALFNTLNITYPSEYFNPQTLFTFAGGRFNLSSAEQNVTDISYQMMPPRTNGFTDLRIFFPSVESGFLNVTKNDELKFYVMYAFDDRMTVQRKDNDQYFTFNWTLTPVMPFNATFEEEIKIPSLGTLKNETIAFNFPFSAVNQTMKYGINYTTTSTSLKIANVSLIDLIPLVGTNSITFANITYTNETYGNLTATDIIPWVHFEYTSIRPLATCLETERTVRIVPWGYLLVTERQFIQVNGAELTGTPVRGLEKVKLIIPQNASQLTGYDAMGNLTLDVTESGNFSSVEFTFRNVLRGTSSYEFYFSYRLPLEEHITIDDTTGFLTLELPVVSGFNWTIRELTEHIILPEGGTFHPDYFQNTSIFEINGTSDKQVYLTRSGEIQEETGFGRLIQRQKMTLTAQNLFEYHYGSITVVYRSPSFALLQIPLFISAFLFILGFVYIGMHQIRIRVTPTRAIEREIPIKILEDFVTVYNDKTALDERLRRIDERFRRKRITRTAYQHEKRVLDRELRQTEKRVSTLKSQLRAEGRRYRDMIEELEVNETEKVTILSSVEELTDRRRKGRISKEVFARLQREYTRRLQRTANRIDRILVEMREEIVLGSRK